MTPRTRTALAVAGVVALTVAARLPFLLRGDRFFAADEAVEGLMARHVLLGEFPLFFWGQAYKGVPEVYAAALVFSAAGSSVLALQAVTLAFFAAFIGLQFILISRLFSLPVAWLTSLFAIVSPPSLVYWSLVGVAEISVTLLAGAMAVLAAHAWRQTRSLRALAVFAFAIGFGLWVQQYMFYYLVAIAAAAWIDAPRARRSTIADLVAADGAPRWVAVSARILLAGAIVYAALGLHSFFTGGFTSSVFGVPVENIHPQKLWRISAVLFVIATSASWWWRVRRRDPDLVRQTVIAGGAFLVGFSPYIVGRLRGGGVSAPMRSANAVEMWEATRRSANEMAPILFGFRGPGTEPLQVPAAMSLALVAIAVLSVRGHSPQPGNRVLPCVSVGLGRAVSGERRVRGRAIVSVPDADLCRGSADSCRRRARSVEGEPCGRIRRGGPRRGSLCRSRDPLVSNARAGRATGSGDRLPA